RPAPAERARPGPEPSRKPRPAARSRDEGPVERTRDRPLTRRTPLVAAGSAEDSSSALGEAQLRRSRRAPLPLPLLILAGVVLLILATVALRTWRSYSRELPQVAQLGFTEGIPALKEGKFDKAYQLLSAAKDAVVALRDQVEHAGEIRSAADQS